MAQNLIGYIMFLVFVFVFLRELLIYKCELSAS